MERPKCAGEQERHNQDARSKNQHMLGLAQIEAADPTDKQVGYDKVEEAPQDIDPCGGCGPGIACGPVMAAPAGPAGE
jgi:hypothetical protein